MKRSNVFTSKLGPVIARYLAVKESLGRRYWSSVQSLPTWIAFLERSPRNDSELTAKTFRSGTRHLRI